MSNVVQYDFKGNIINNFTIVGHDDGLRYNPRTNTLWAVQNEDGNSNLSIINLWTGKQEIFQIGTGPHGGGYDNFDFSNNSVYLSASAPTINSKTAPAIVSLQMSREGVAPTGILIATRPPPCDYGYNRDAESPGSRLDDSESAW